VRVENTRTTRPQQLVHRAAFYTSHEHLLAITMPAIHDALRQKMPVALIASPSTERTIRQRLDGSTGLIHLPPPGPLVRDSGQAVVTQRARELRELTGWAGPIAVIAEHHCGHIDSDAAAWVEADAAMNIALSSLPITMTCLYPTGLGPDAVDAVRWNHTHLIEPDGTVRENIDVRPPDDVLAMYPVAAPPPLGRPQWEMTFSPWQLIDLRTTVAEATKLAGLEPEQAEDFVLAVNEVASNAVEHGYGIGLLQLWLPGNQLICEVHDTGVLGEPLPGLRPPHPNSPRGRGVWIARQLCDLLHVWSDGEGTHVRLQAVRA
jgi:anti-sigma regulatory factor (Ser/Thr protein kinase)